jgi:hypothetical protein
MGDSEDVHWTDQPPRQTSRARGAKRVGLLYERRVLDVLSAIYGERFRESPVIAYRTRGRRHLAIPDGILYLNDAVLILEVKLGHTELVWPQLMDKYRPLVSVLHPDLRVRTVEVCRSYDPAVPIPHSLITSLHTGCVPGLEVLRWRI